MTHNIYPCYASFCLTFRTTVFAASDFIFTIHLLALFPNHTTHIKMCLFMELCNTECTTPKTSHNWVSLNKTYTCFNLHKLVQVLKNINNQNWNMSNSVKLPSTEFHENSHLCPFHGSSDIPCNRHRKANRCIYATSLQINLKRNIFLYTELGRLLLRNYNFFLQCWSLKEVKWILLL